MNYLGIDYDVKNMPVLDEGFVPFGVWMKAYLEGATQPIAVAVEREDGLISVRESAIRGGEFAEADFRYVERLVKFELWSIGGFRVYLRGCDDIAAKLAEAYSQEGARAFDYGFVGDVYEKPLEVVACTEADFPAANEAAWRAAASASTPAGRTARCRPSSTASRCTPRRSCGSRRSRKTRSTTSTRS